MVRVHIERQGGATSAPLVLLHGGIGAGRYHWSRLIGPLADRFQVVLPDLPGHGRTPLPDDGRYDRDVLVAAVRDLLRAEGPPVHVGGFSLGGHTALALAAEEPRLFASLVLVGVSVRDHDGLREWRERFVPDVFERRFPLWARQLSRLHEPQGGPDAWRDVSRRDAGGLDVAVDLGALARLDCPVLLVRGDRDPAVNPDHYAELRDIWPHADELVVPAGGHDVQLSRSELVRPALLDFYDRITSERNSTDT